MNEFHAFFYSGCDHRSEVSLPFDNSEGMPEVELEYCNDRYGSVLKLANKLKLEEAKRHQQMQSYSRTKFGIHREGEPVKNSKQNKKYINDRTCIVDNNEKLLAETANDFHSEYDDSDKENHNRLIPNK